MTARTPRQPEAGEFELGARYQGLFAGSGLGFDPEHYDQLAASLRWGIVDWLELETEGSFIVFHDIADGGSTKVDFGDVRLAVQTRILRSGPHLLGIYTGLTLPTGPSNIDVLPPFFADGTLDFEGLVLYELAPIDSLRLIANLGWISQGTRTRAPAPSFDVPDALRYDLALALNLGSSVQLSLELNGRYHTDKKITPVWLDNQHILELTPGVRIEMTPRLVLEAGAGFAMNDDTRRIYKVRALVGLTYEFSLY
jgi:hypothetical protein